MLDLRSPAVRAGSWNPLLTREITTYPAADVRGMSALRHSLMHVVVCLGASRAGGSSLRIDGILWRFVVRSPQRKNDVCLTAV